MIPSGSAPRAAPAEASSSVALGPITVPPVDRIEITRLIEGGTIDMDGYKEVVLSFGGEVKDQPMQAGTVGAILIPDEDDFDRILQRWGRFSFPIEVRTAVGVDEQPIFLAKQVTARIAFPRYRVLLYNGTDKAVSVFLFAYRTP